MRPELQKKIEQSINLLKKFDNPDNPVEIAYSGGKDSDVILQLAKEAGIAYRAIYAIRSKISNQPKDSGTRCHYPKP